MDIRLPATCACLALLWSTTAIAQSQTDADMENFSAAAAMPDTSHPKSFSDGGLTFDYPGDWKVVQHETLGDGCFSAFVEWDKPGFGGLALDAHVIGCPAEADTLDTRRYAQQLVEFFQEDPAKYIDTTYADLALPGAESAVLSTYTLKVLAHRPAYGEKILLVAERFCGEDRQAVCSVYSESVAVNLESAKAALSLLLTSAEFKPVP